MGKAYEHLFKYLSLSTTLPTSRKTVPHVKMSKILYHKLIEKMHQVRGGGGVRLGLGLGLGLGVRVRVRGGGFAHSPCF